VSGERGPSAVLNRSCSDRMVSERASLLAETGGEEWRTTAESTLWGSWLHRGAKMETWSREGYVEHGRKSGTGVHCWMIQQRRKMDVVRGRQLPGCTS